MLFFHEVIFIAVNAFAFKLYSIYMHLKNAQVKFSSYQKMLRQVSFNHYPNIEVKKEAVIGGMGSSGNSEGFHVHLHLQLEFRDEKGNIIVIDPAKVFGMPSSLNLSSAESILYSTWVNSTFSPAFLKLISPIS